MGFLTTFITVYALYSLIDSTCAAKYLGGIPVPGRTVPATRFFELYGSSCLPNTRRSAILQHIANLLENFDAEELANKMYNSLYFAVADVDITKVMGRWFTVVDSPAIHSDRCVITYFESLNNNAYTATFSIRQYSRNSEEVSMVEGYGTKTGIDPGAILFITGHPSDPCPYSLIRTGPINDDGLYAYLILSQPLKYPTMVLARDPIIFDGNHKKEVKEFLDRHHFWNAVSALNNELYFVNTSSCLISQHYRID